MPGIRSLGSLSKTPPKHKAMLIEFPEWGKGPVFEWYNNELKNDAAWKIERLQIRKDTSGVVPHRNIAVTTKDELSPFLDAESIRTLEHITKCKIELNLKGEVDLKVIIYACCGITKDPSAKKYTLFSHNCFFFSWTILMVVARNYLPYHVPVAEPLLKRAKDMLPGLSTYIVEEIVMLLLGIVIDTVTMFRNKAGDAVHRGMSFITWALWVLPTPLLQFSWQKIFRARLHFGLRRQLELRVIAELEKRVLPVVEGGLDDLKQAPDKLDGKLWLDHLRPLIKPIIKTEITCILWDTILDAIAGGYGPDIEGEQLANELMDPKLKFNLMGRNAAQFSAVWGAALHGGLPAAHEAAYGKSAGGAVSDAEMFDLVWNAARDGALASAKRVVVDTHHQMRHPDLRDKMWEAIWEIWDDC
ncbi:hypothetical protein H0H81_001939 [Sphagnurus paluster]|uniref:Uncharacterized protein n=1 Tax=Sphagnurus paluster TaxID=117069 RepID=A0A9P7FM97_9AGAR|nr:hypothetical protein H0H81_001939 [Sphagnurus paluster]